MNELVKEMHNIEYALRLLYHELNAQLSEGFVDYVIEFGGEKFIFDAYATQEERNRFIKLIFDDAMEVSTRCAVSADLEGMQAWDRIIHLIAMRIEKEDVASPMSAQEYQAIKDEAASSCKAKAINLESIYVNMQRPDWAEEDQIAFIEGKEDVD